MLNDILKIMQVHNLTISTNNKWNRRISIKINDDGSGCFYYGNVKITKLEFRDLGEAYINLKEYMQDIT